MKTRNQACVILVVCCSAMFAALTLYRADAGVPQSAAVILKPQTKVKATDEVVVKALTVGRPVVLVRPKDADGQWSVQKPALNTSGRFFKTRAAFGNAQTPTGQVFQVVALMPRSDAVASQFQTGSLLNELPAGVARSKEAEVVPQRPNQSTTSLEVIQVPRDGAIVGRNPQIRGRVAKSIRPVILVRSTEPNCKWWIQKPVAYNTAGEFQSTLRIGTDTTPADTTFRIVAMLPRTASQQALFVDRAWLKELPSNVPQAKPVNVVFRPSVTAQADGDQLAGELLQTGGKAATAAASQSEGVTLDPADRIVITTEHNRLASASCRREAIE